MAVAAVGNSTLQGFLAGVHQQDGVAGVGVFTEDVRFETPRGPDPNGRRLTGKAEVRKGIEARFAGIPDIHYGDDRHWVCGDRGVSEWLITGRATDGRAIEVRGCDLFEFADGKICRKDS